MRSHAKASPVGSNLGRDNTRSFRRSGALTGLLVALMASACLLPGSASAVEIRTLTESFGPNGIKSGDVGSNSFSFPKAVAFDQGNKRLYVLDEESIHGFDSSTPATHTPLGGSFPLSTGFAGEFTGLAADPSSHDLFYATPEENKLFGYDESGAPLSGFPVTGFNFSCGTAVDSEGNIWVAEGNVGDLKKFSPAGALIETLTVGGLPCHLAFDAEDNLYVGFYYDATKKFTASSGYTTSTTIDSEFTSAMTVSKATGEVFVIHYNYIKVWDTDGTFLYEFAEPVGGGYAGIAIDESTEEAYVSDYEFGKVRVFSPPAAVPKLSTDPASGITATEATVNGTVNPKGQAVEECHFEVVSASQFAPHQVVIKEKVKVINEKGEEKEEFIDKETVIRKGFDEVTPAQEYPCVPAAGSIPADSEPHAVSANVSGLNPATTYHYRPVAKNAIGEALGTSRAFTTSALAPLIQEQSIDAIGTTEATVSAKINPRGGETTYHVEYGTTNAYGQSTTESAPLGFPTDNTKHPVSVHIGGLQPGTAYHFRFVATNEVDTTEGADTTFATYPTGQSFASCPSEEFRVAAGSRLPDCRAYEQVSPIEKHGAGAQGTSNSIGTSPSGDRVTFFANGGLPTSGGSSGLYPYLASRGAEGWSTDGFLPPTENGFGAEIVDVSEDLSAALVLGEEPGGVGRQLFLRDSDTAAFEPGPAAPEFLGLAPVGFAADPAHLAFLSRSQLLPGALGGKPNLYDLNDGTLTLAGRVPAGSATSCDDEAGPACVVPPQGTTQDSQSAKISREGSRVFFTANPTKEAFNAGRIYMREDGTRTTWISASQRTTADPGGEKPAELVHVTPDGSKAFFLSCEKLTDNSTAVSTGENTCTGGGNNPVQGQDLYSYDVETGELTDLTVDSNPADPLGAAVQEVLGISEDGSYIYFLANGVLAEGASLVSDKCPGFTSDCNIYAHHAGVTTFIAQVNWAGAGKANSSRVSADGSAFLFSVGESLTGYDNVGPCGFSGGIIPCPEFFRYSAPDEELLCVTCVPTGTPPTGLFPSLGGKIGGNFILDGNASPGPSRNVSADGNRVFFDSTDALVPGDTNGVKDVYEWEAKGTGSCESESQNGGCIYLISSGSDPQPSGFLDASRNGDHAFFFTEQSLVPGDGDQLYDVYDAGVGAGLAAQHTLAPPTCSSTACQANPAPPVDQTPASASFQGPGNAKPRPKARKCPKGKRKVRSGGKVRCKSARKQHKRHNNRGGSK